MSATVFVRYYQEVPRPAPEVETALSHVPQSWLPEIVMSSTDCGMHMMERVGVSVGARRLDHRVHLEISPSRQMGDIRVMTISWRPVTKKSVLPSLDGEVEISPLGDDRAQLAISARYEPPLGWLGAIADRALMRRVAETTVKDFLDHVAEGVVAAIPEVGCSPD